MNNVDLEFAKNQMDLAIQKRDIISFRKWSNIYWSECKRRDRESMTRCLARIDQLNQECTRDLEKIRSWTR